MTDAESAPSSLRSVRPGSSLRAEVEAMLSSAIVSGELAPGTLVSVPQLAVQFHVSATPVREAMLDLQKRGFVDPVRNKGFRVTEVGEHDIREIVTLRCWLEAPAMREVARVFPGERSEEFRALADAIVDAVGRDDLRDYLAADVAFHRALLELLGSRRLVEEVARLRQETRMVGLAGMLGTPELRASATEHHDILDLLERGDGDALERLMVRHIGHVVTWWNGLDAEAAPEPLQSPLPTAGG